MAPSSICGGGGGVEEVYRRRLLAIRTDPWSELEEYDNVGCDESHNLGAEKRLLLK